MRERRVTVSELLLIGATRVMIGFGAGLLISRHLGEAHRKAVGLPLLIAGGLSTIPLVLRVFCRGEKHQETPLNVGAPLMAD